MDVQLLTIPEAPKDSLRRHLETKYPLSRSQGPKYALSRSCKSSISALRAFFFHAAHKHSIQHRQFMTFRVQAQTSRKITRNHAKRPQDPLRSYFGAQNHAKSRLITRTAPNSWPNGTPAQLQPQTRLRAKCLLGMLNSQDLLRSTFVRLSWAKCALRRKSQNLCFLVGIFLESTWSPRV